MWLLLHFSQDLFDWSASLRGGKGGWQCWFAGRLECNEFGFQLFCEVLENWFIALLFLLSLLLLILLMLLLLWPKVFQLLNSLWTFSLLIFSYTWACTSSHFWKSETVGWFPIDVIVYSVHFIRILCGIFSFAFFINVELCKSALKPKCLKACTNRLRKEAKDTKLCLL